MLKILAFLWSGCWHKWRTVERGTLVQGGKSIGCWWELKCERCGAPKYKKGF